MKMYKSKNFKQALTYEEVMTAMTISSDIIMTHKEICTHGFAEGLQASVEGDAITKAVMVCNSIEEARVVLSKFADSIMRSAFIKFFDQFELVEDEEPKVKNAYNLLELQAMLKNGQIVEGTALTDNNGFSWMIALGALVSIDQRAAVYGLKEYNDLTFTFDKDELAPLEDAGIPCEMKTEPEPTPQTKLRKRSPKPRKRYKFRNNSVTVFNNDDTLYALALDNKLIVSIKRTVHVVDMDKGFVAENILDAFGVKTFQDVIQNKKRFKYSKNLIKNIIKTY